LLLRSDQAAAAIFPINIGIINIIEFNIIIEFNKTTRFRIEMKSLKLSVAVLMLAGMLGSALVTEAYPPFVKKAEKYGAKNCLFCHTQASGGEGWNKRGDWLIAEKDKRKADAIDVTWLEEYKEEEGEKKPQ